MSKQKKKYVLKLAEKFYRDMRGFSPLENKMLNSGKSIKEVVALKLKAAFDHAEGFLAYAEKNGYFDPEPKPEPEKVGGFDEMLQGMLRLAKSKPKSEWRPVVADQFPFDNQVIDVSDGCNTHHKCTYFNGEIFDSKEKRIELWNGAALNGWEWRYAQEEAKPEPGIEYPWNQASVSSVPKFGYKIEVNFRNEIFTGKYGYGVFADDENGYKISWNDIVRENAEWRYAE